MYVEIRIILLLLILKNLATVEKVNFRQYNAVQVRLKQWKIRHLWENGEFHGYIIPTVNLCSELASVSSSWLSFNHTNSVTVTHVQPCAGKALAAEEMEVFFTHSTLCPKSIAIDMASSSQSDHKTGGCVRSERVTGPPYVAQKDVTIVRTRGPCDSHPPPFPPGMFTVVVLNLVGHCKFSMCKANILYSQISASRGASPVLHG